MFNSVDEAQKPKQFSSGPVKKAAASEPRHGLARWKTLSETMFFLATKELVFVYVYIYIAVFPSTDSEKVAWMGNPNIMAYQNCYTFYYYYYYGYF